MKEITSLFMMMFLLIGTLGFVVAEESENNSVLEVGENETSEVEEIEVPEVEDEDDEVPEAKRVGFFKNQMFKLGLAFTFNKEKKIDRILTMAEERLAEAELLAEEDPEGYAEAQARYDELVVRAEEILANIESNGDENESVAYIEKIARVQAKFERHKNHTNVIYDRALERFAANNASDEKIARFEMFRERALNRTNQMEAHIFEKRENALRRHKALSEMSDEELENLEGESLRRARADRFGEGTKEHLDDEAEEEEAELEEEAEQGVNRRGS